MALKAEKEKPVDWNAEATMLLEEESLQWERKKLVAARHRMESMITWEATCPYEQRKKDKFLESYMKEWKKKPYWGPTKFL